jgi:5'-nucleotidase
VKWTVLVVVVVSLAVGCASKPKTDAKAQSDGAMDVTPMTTPVAATPQPVLYDVAPVSPAPAATGSYTVQRGDTLWRIATNQYGDGKQWQKIAAANPGVTPQSLKVGQVLTIP